MDGWLGGGWIDRKVDVWRNKSFITTVLLLRGVQTIFLKNNVKITFRGWGVKMRDVSRLLTGYLL